MLSGESPALTRTGFGIDAAGNISEAHQQASLQAQLFQTIQQHRIRVECRRLFIARNAEIACAHDHQRHRGIDAGDLDAVDRVDALPGRKDLAGDCAPGVEKVQQDRRRRARNAVDPGIALIGHALAGRSYRDVNARAGVDVEDAHARGPVLRLDQPLLDREGRDARQHVAAVGPGVDRPVARHRPARTGSRYRSPARSNARRSRPCC